MSELALYLSGTAEHAEVPIVPPVIVVYTGDFPELPERAQRGVANKRLPARTC